ncbi:MULTISPECIES: hypothetical protein [Gemella]|uniref:hypothetical protein n=1 Tax=Gemella TaxID=1378 RepID=UPI0007680D49|nr:MULTISPECIES: hypothetical protein [Gemella]AME08957.1 hypothetical protein AXE85_01625 [Gemella sp. oral taxon 928]AXI26527.1 hypothetical protein CG018_03395 [Gemella sp. ND 6198]
MNKPFKLAGAIISLIPRIGVFGSAAVSIIVSVVVGNLISNNFDYSRGIVAYFKYGHLVRIYSQ